ncbi:MAG: ribosome biogenesis GTPase Der [Candidatus Uhrbacteria bacterium]|nr:ribosome biogenesis GTPase Der [Candidatus Uhrbacteria bacterium]
MTPPKIAIIGRTNVGKSTLFNRLVEAQKSLVSEVPGTTRDRFEADCIWRGKVVRLIDTGGLDTKASDQIERDIALQARAAIKEADVILFIVDAIAGLQKEDRDLAKELMKTKKPVIVAANKADNARIRSRLTDKEWFNWSLATPMAVSAKQGIGAGDLLDEIFNKLKEIGLEPTEISEIALTRVAVVGRPNVGKSSLLNAALGEHRFITSEIEHTTREPNDTLMSVDGHDYLFVDTAGVRKMARVNAGNSKLEKSGVDKTLRAVRRADVALFVIDITKKISSQDKHLAGMLAAAGASTILIANKWDLIPDKDSKMINEYERYLRAMLPMLDYAPILFTSALTGQRVQTLFDIIDKVYQSRFTQLTKNETREFISRAIVKHKPSRGKGIAHPHIRYFEQGNVNPPTFFLGLKQARKDVLADSYLRFLENQLRKSFDFEGTPIRIVVKSRTRTVEEK